MHTNSKIHKSIAKRLLPLYISAFLHSFVLWYTIEKLFMKTIGFDNNGIAQMIALYSAVMLLVETPSGILADRWSRKGVLMLASICLSLSALIGGLSQNRLDYLVCAILWGIFFACYSGMYDSIVYDTLAEEAPDEKIYDYYFGRVQLLDSLALVISSLLGSLIASHFNLRSVYFLTVPIALIPIYALYKFKEPKIHKQHAVITLKQQFKDTFKAVTINRSVLSIVLVLILRSMIIYCIYEFAQLWLLELKTPTSYFGMANATLLASIGLGGYITSKLKLGRHTRMMMLLTVMLFSSAGLVVFRNTFSIVLSQLCFATALISIYIIFSRLLHDNLPASIRAGAASASSTLGRFAVIPTALLIGFISQKYQIYNAGIILLVLSVIMTILIVKISSSKQYTGLES